MRGDTIRLGGRRYVADLADGGRAELTLDPQLQRARRAAAHVPDPVRGRRGRLGPRRARAGAGRAVGRRSPPGRRGAGAAPLGARRLGVQGRLRGGAGRERRHRAATRTCYHGGVSSVLADNLVDLPALDRRCDTLAFGLGKSQNAIIAKLATRHLTAGGLARVGRSFGFGEAIPFDLPIEPSHLDVPADQLEFARTAAGFWHSTLSPMHGALLAAAIANRGRDACRRR